MWQFKNSTDGMLVRIINGFKAICTQSYDGGLDVPNEGLS